MSFSFLTSFQWKSLNLIHSLSCIFVKSILGILEIYKYYIIRRLLNLGYHTQQEAQNIQLTIPQQIILYFHLFQIMSTLAAARADNFYISKNYDPKNIKPSNKQLSEQKPFVVVEGERVGGGKVRYQTPFHVRCQGCQNMVAKGVRFNAIQTWVGNFHSTKIYQFRMKCPQCIQRFVVRTDPQNCEYLYVSGAKRIFQAKDCTDQSRVRDQQAQQKQRQDPFSKLEAQYKDKELYGNLQEAIQKIQEHQERGLEDFQLNRILRKKVCQLKQDQQQYLIEKRQKNMLIPLLNQQKQDEIMASSIKFKKTKPIVKKEQIKSERDRLKQKMKKLNPAFKKQLKNEIIENNRPKSSIFSKK